MITTHLPAPPCHTVSPARAAPRSKPHLRDVTEFAPTNRLHLRSILADYVSNSARRTSSAKRSVLSATIHTNRDTAGNCNENQYSQPFVSPDARSTSSTTISTTCQATQPQPDLALQVVDVHHLQSTRQSVRLLHLPTAPPTRMTDIAERVCPRRTPTNNSVFRATNYPSEQ